MPTLNTIQRNGVAEVIAAGFRAAGTPATFTTTATTAGEATVTIEGQDEPIRVSESGIRYPEWVSGDLAYWIDVEARLYLGAPRPKP